MKTIVLALTTCLAATPAYALYCDNRLITNGDPIARVHAICGAPIHVRRYVIYEVQEYVTAHRPLRPGLRDARYPRATPYEMQTIVPIEIEEWTYNFGPSRFLHRITFQNGYLQAIATSGYGF